MNNYKGKVVKMFVWSLLWILIEAHLASTVSAKEHILLEKQLEEYVNEHEQHLAGLATIVVKEDEVIYKMKGYANIEEQIPANEHTVFEWATVSKVLIWISVLQLVESGKLDLETDIETYLPDDFHSKTTFKDPIILHHLMHHTAGFDDSFTDLMK